MTTLVVDASVWVAAADSSDQFSNTSRAFLARVTEQQIPVAVPDIVFLEVSCALARRLRDAKAARALCATMLAPLSATVHRADAALMDLAITLGTDTFLRAADAFYAAVARKTGGTLVSWDEELIARAGAVTPD